MSTHRADRPLQVGAAFEVLRETVAQLAAVASALGDERAQSPGEAYRIDPSRAAVLDELAVDPIALLAEAWPQRASRSRVIASGLGQAAAAAGNAMPHWTAQRDDVIVAQGEASVMVGKALAQRVVPRCPGLPERMARGGAILDVGTGIGALALALAEAFPRATVTGVDVAPRPLEIAQARLAGAAGVAMRDRITYREQDVFTLGDQAVYDLVWVPSVFLPSNSLDKALRRVAGAVAPGGWIVVGTDADSVTGAPQPGRAWLAGVAGGSAETVSAAKDRLGVVGASHVRAFPTVPGGPVLVAGQLA